MGYVSKNIDHLGIVAAVCKELELVEEVDKIVGVKDKQKVLLKFLKEKIGVFSPIFFIEKWN